MKIPAIPVSRWGLNSEGNAYRTDGYVGIQTDSPSGLLGLRDANTYITVDASNNLVFADVNVGEKTLSSLVNQQDQTQEAFTISIDYNTGEDPTNSIILSNQTDSTEYGTFRTIPAAINALPSSLLHRVTLQLADGSHTLDNNFLGAWYRLQPDITPDTGQVFPYDYGGITLESLNGLVIVSGTSTMSVASSGTNTVALDSDPGFTDNEHRGRMLYDTTSNEYRPIVSHSGVNFVLAGNWQTSPSTNVEVRQPAAELIVPPATAYPAVLAQTPANYTPSFPAFILNSIDIIAPSGGGFLYIVGGSWSFDGGSLIKGFQIEIRDATINIHRCSIDGNGDANYLVQTTGTTSLFNGFGYGWYMRGSTLSPVRLLAGGSTANPGSNFLCFGGTIEGASLYAIEANGPNASLDIKTEIIRGSGFSYAFRTREGSTIVGSDTYVLDSDFIGGSVADIYHDETAIDFETIDGDSDGVALGKHGSRVLVK